MFKSAPVPLGGVIEIPLSVVSVRSKGFDRLQDFSWTIIPLLTSGTNGRKKTKRSRPTVPVHQFLLLQPLDARETEGRSSGSGGTALINLTGPGQAEGEKSLCRSSPSQGLLLTSLLPGASPMGMTEKNTWLWLFNCCLTLGELPNTLEHLFPIPHNGDRS